jgi:hypothetical protein
LENENLQKNIYKLLCEHNALASHAESDTPFEDLPENIRKSLREVVNLTTAMVIYKARPLVSALFAKPSPPPERPSDIIVDAA